MSDAPKLQYAALPYRKRTDGLVEVMLITSRGTGRWVIPKGWPIAELTPLESAAREAFEEAGITGRIREEPIGRYGYRKDLDTGSHVACAVNVFALEVEEQLPAWPEQAQRRTQWFDAREAAAAVHEPELRDIISSLGKSLS